MALTLDDLKAHLRVDYDDEDAEITRLLAAATRHIEGQLGFTIADEDEFPGGTPADIEHAILMVAASWYENREAVGAGLTFQPLPMGVDDILRNYRRYTFGAIDG